MFIETWVAVAIAVTTLVMLVKTYLDGWAEGHDVAIQVHTAATVEGMLKTLAKNKIIRMVESESGKVVIIPGDMDEFIAENESKEP